MIKENTKRAIILAGLGMLLLTGCGSSKTNENVTLGMQAVEGLQYNQALTNFEDALLNKEDPELVYRGQGLAYMGLVQYENAIRAFENALSNCTSLPGNLEYDINYYMATCYYKLGNLESALEIYDAIIELRPKEKDAFYMRGTIRLEMGLYEEAVKDFDQAVSLDKTDYSLYIDIYSALAASGYTEAGQSYLQSVIDGDSESISNYDKGRLYFYLENYDYAANYLEQARDDTNPEASLLLGKSYEERGDYNYAISVYSKFLEKNEDASLYNQLGICQMKMEEYQSALESFQAGMALGNPDLMQTLSFNEICAYEYMGDYQQAAVLMKKYVEIYPDDQEAAREYEFLKTR